MSGSADPAPFPWLYPYHFVEWQAEVGFVDHWLPTFSMLLGQGGFFDRFTVTMSQHARQTAIEPAQAFDERFGISVAR